MPVLHLYNVHTNIADLGYFVSNIIRAKNEWQVAFYGHIQPILLINKLLKGEYLPEIKEEIDTKVKLNNLIAEKERELNGL